jgi:hypothetical protein
MTGVQFNFVLYCDICLAETSPVSLKVFHVTPANFPPVVYEDSSISNFRFAFENIGPSCVSSRLLIWSRLRDRSPTIRIPIGVANHNDYIEMRKSTVDL